MNKAISITAAFAVLSACAAAEPEIDWSYESTVRADTPAGNVKAVTGQVIRTKIESDRVSSREIEIWLPGSYATQPGRRYPVLYMHDGQNVFDPAGSEYSGWDWGVDEAMTSLGIEAIVVAPHSDSETRNIDYFPQKAADVYGDVFRRDFGPDFTPETLNADDYLFYLTQEVKPYIDANYRTLPEVEHTSVMGSTMGGLISLYAISEYPNVFGQAGMVSTHFPLADGILTEYFATRLPDPETHRLYFDYGTETLDYNYEGFQDRMDAAVVAAGYVRGENWTTRKFEGADHSERAWRNRVHVPLQFLLTGEAVKGGEEK